MRARIGGYVVDMVIFAAVAMVMIVIAGFVLLLATDFAEQDPEDSDTYTFLSIIGLGIPLVWTLINVTLLATRGQTGGQYVAGVRVAREDGERPSAGNALAWWLALNPLLFSWPMAIVVGFPLAAVVALVSESVTLAFTAALVIVCIMAPIVALTAALVDARNRTLHDRIANTDVVTVE